MNYLYFFSQFIDDKNKRDKYMEPVHLPLSKLNLKLEEKPVEVKGMNYDVCSICLLLLGDNQPFLYSSIKLCLFSYFVHISF